MFSIILICLGIAFYCWRDNIKVVSPITAKDVVLITGGCMGLGKALAIECAKKKCKLIILDIRSDLSMELL
jgi:all-trans-retinol dehydrogenase (NAD+)